MKTRNDSVQFYLSVIEEGNYPFEPYSKSKEDTIEFWCGRWIYLYQNPMNGLTKIGYTSDTYQRFMSIQSQSGNKLNKIAEFQLEAKFDPSAEWIEKELHKMYKSKRKIGEWFDLDIFEIDSIINLFDYMDIASVHDYRDENHRHNMDELYEPNYLSNE